MLVNMLSAVEPSLAGLSVSAREVVLSLKKRGEARASEIAETLGITPSGVRQHLSALRADGLVAYRTIHAGPGRPKFAYFLTEPAEALFPKTYHELTNEFLEHLEEEDPELLVRLFERRRQRRVEATRKRLADKTFDDLIDWLPKGDLADAETHEDTTAVLSASSRAALVTVTKYTAEGSAETAGSSSDLILARQNDRLHVFGRSPDNPATLIPRQMDGKTVRDTLTDLLS